MTGSNIYKDIAERTDGAVMLGIVGPVRTGKSTFIKRFMETQVIPNIDDVYMRERAKDELPQSGSGRTIMTSEPKFVPEEAVGIQLEDGVSFSVRLVDCVGYMVKGAVGQLDDGSERMVATPWFDHEVTMTEAAEQGTHKVISEHSTIGLVVTTDGSICGIPREDYIEPEERAISELISIGKPFVIVLNCADPNSTCALELADELSAKYSVPCVSVNCMTLDSEDIGRIMTAVLGQFPLVEADLWLPSWLDSLDDECELKQQVYSAILAAAGDLSRLSDVGGAVSELKNSELFEDCSMNADMGSGIVSISLEIPKRLYYKLISEYSGFSISDDGDLMRLLGDMRGIKQDYDHIKSALDSVRETGYGVVLPNADELDIEQPQIVKQGGRYAVKLKASAPAIHMLKTGVVAEVSPAISGEGARDEILSFLLQGYDGDMSKLWESNIFGKSLYDIARESISDKLEHLPSNARAKLQETLQRIINEGNGRLICILL